MNKVFFFINNDNQYNLIKSKYTFIKSYASFNIINYIKNDKLLKEQIVYSSSSILIEFIINIIDISFNNESLLYLLALIKEIKDTNNNILIHFIIKKKKKTTRTGTI